MCLLVMNSLYSSNHKKEKKEEEEKNLWNLLKEICGVLNPITSPPDLWTYTDINKMLSGYKTSKHNMLREFVLESMYFS